MLELKPEHYKRYLEIKKKSHYLAVGKRDQPKERGRRYLMQMEGKEVLFTSIPAPR